MTARHSFDRHAQDILATALGLAEAMERTERLGPVAIPPRPWTGPVPQGPCEIADVLGRARESSLATGDRIQTGAHHTPPSLARALARQALDERQPERVFDPCCGAGVFLCAIGETRLQRGEDPVAGLVGWDRDPLAVHTTRLVLALAFGLPLDDDRVRCCDALTVDWPEVDLVITNPPFVSSGLSKGGLGPEKRKQLRDRFPIGFQRRSDLAGAFVEAAVHATAPGGRVALVLPESLLATQAAQSLRDWLTEEAPPSQVHLLGSDLFPDAQVRAATWLLERGATLGDFQLESRSPWNHRTVPAEQLREAPWSAVVVSPQPLPDFVPPVDVTPLADRGQLRRGFTDDFYFLSRSIVEANTTQPSHPVVSVGLVDPGRHWWGERRAKIAGRWYERPALDRNALAKEDPKRAARVLETQRDKRLVLATRSAVLECCAVEAGVIAQVPLITLSTKDPDELDLIYAQLLSPFATAWYLSRYGHLDQTGAGVDLRVPALAEMPLRPSSSLSSAERSELQGRLEALAVHPGAGELKAVQCFALDLLDQPRDGLMTWWWERLPKKLVAGYNR